MTLHEDPTQADAVVALLERGVGRLLEGATTGTPHYWCACTDRDAVKCAAAHYGMDYWGGACDCQCHRDGDDDDY